MLLHIGNDISIFKNDIIAILNKKSIEESPYNKNLINKLIQDGKFKNQIDEDINSYILSFEDGELFIYGSNISSNTLLKRKVI